MVPAAAVTVVPDDVPPARAVLAGTVETAVNALWDAAPLIGDRIAVVGAGMVGCCVARLLAAVPGASRSRSSTSTRRGPRSPPRSASASRGPDDADGRIATSCVHTSATSAGLQRSLDLLAPEGTVLDLSWYGDTEVRLSLGGAFHSGRLGHPRQPGRDRRRRRAAARRTHAPTGWRSPSTCCATRPSTRCSPARRAFDELPDVMARLADGSLPALCHTITYDGSSACSA